jgi:2-phosphoglycolate phosphatase
LTQSIRALVFDLDGTLIDSRGDIAAAVNHTLSTSGRDTLSERTIASFVGDGASKLLQRATGLVPEAPEFERLLTLFRAYYTAHATIFTQLYPNVRETLSTLTQLPFKLALCTNKPRMTTDRVLFELDLSRYFEVVVCADDLPFQKPHPAPLLHIAERLGVLPSEIVMIGDGPQDVNCGKAAGARTVGVTYGIKGAADVAAAGPDELIDGIDGIWRFLGKHAGANDEKLAANSSAALER